MPPESSSIPEPVRLRPIRREPAAPEAVASTALGTLPRPLTSLIGREAEVATTVALLHDRDCRLLTLTGPGGVGKTRLALAVATEIASAVADGVALVELAPVRDPGLVPAAVAVAVGVQDLGLRPLRESLLMALGDRDLLLVIDNFEHVLPAAPLVADLLTNCPRLRVLVSSRAPLALSGERLCPVRPLALAPDGQRGSDVGPAVTLFVVRAQAVATDFRLTDANAANVLQICRNLEGLPLAIELAAARMRILQPAALLARLDRRLSFLTGGTRDQPHRLRTMGDAIAWSYDLLSSAEQRLFQRLAVFVSGFTLEAAEWVAGIGSPVPGPGGEIASSVLDLIGSLLDHSLITREIGFDGASRFGMLETIREYGLERLGASGDEAAVRDAHARYCLAFAERYAPEFFRDDDVVLRVDAIAGEHANMLAALAHLSAAEMDDEQVRLAALLGPFWFLGSLHSVGRASLERALARPTSLPAVEAMALANLARLETFQGDHLAAAATLERAVERAMASGDPVALAHARTGQAILTVFQGDYAAAQERAAEAEALARSGHDPLAADFARFVQARAVYYGGDLERAEALYRELLVDPPPRYAETTYRYSLAMIARSRGKHEEALTLYAASLQLFLDLGEQWSVATCLEGVAEALAGLGRAAAAARVFGTAAALRVTLGVPMLPADLADYECTVADVRAHLGTDAFSAAWGAGGALSATAAVAEVTTEAAAALGAVKVIDQPARTADSLSALTTREREVLRLLVLGWSDKEIAASLAIGRRTVSNHVATIRDKLEAPSRAAAAAVAVRDHLV